MCVICSVCVCPCVRFNFTIVSYNTTKYTLAYEVLGNVPYNSHIFKACFVLAQFIVLFILQQWPNKNCEWNWTIMCANARIHLYGPAVVFICWHYNRPHWGRDKMANISQTTFSNAFSRMISLKFVPTGPINNIPALVQIMAWRRPGDKPLSETTMA